MSMSLSGRLSPRAREPNTWAQVIAENRARMKFFEESLELTVRGRLAGAAMDEAIEDDAEASLTDKQ